MAHSHTHEKGKGLTLAFWLNLIFSIIELVGGLLTNSTAIITDALHDFMDAMSIGMAVVLEKWSSKPATAQFTYGFKRFSLLSALLMSALLLIGSIVMVANAVEAFNNQEVVHSVGMLGLAVLGIAVNGFAVFKIKEEHIHTHHGQTQNSKAIMLHLVEDLLGWIAVLIGAVVIYFTNWYWIDSVLAIMIALFIAYNAVMNIKETMQILLMAAPKGINTVKIQQQIQSLGEVKQLIALKVWSLDGIENVASVKVLVSGEKNADKTLANIQQILQEHKVDEVTIQIQ